MVAANFIDPVRVGNRTIGIGEPIFIIAEIGLNHNMDMEMAKKMIDAAVEAGCSAAKFQTFRAADIYVPGELSGTYSLMGKKIPIYDLHVGLEMSEEWVHTLKRYCEERDIIFFSAPIGKEATDILDRANSPVFKISSYECTNTPFIKYIASKNKPIILSTGATTLGEVEAAVRCIQAHNVPLAIMHCITKYPAPYHCANLGVIETLKHAFNVPAGFSDNGFIDEHEAIDKLKVPVAAAEAGADLFEIHITLDRSLPGPDHGFATQPEELRELVQQMKAVRKGYNAGRRYEVDPELLGSSVKTVLPEERYVRDFAFKSIYACNDIEPGEHLDSKNICILRPGEHQRGLEPTYYDLLISKAVASKFIKQWDPITWDLLIS